MMNLDMMLASGPTVSFEQFAELKPDLAWVHPDDEDYQVLRSGDGFVAAIWVTNVESDGEPVSKTLFEHETFPEVDAAKDFVLGRYADSLKS